MASMRVHVRLGEPLWRQVNTREVELELPSGAVVGDMLEALGRRYPELQSYLVEAEVPPTVFLADAMADLTTPLYDGARPTLIWAAAGG